MDVFDLRGRLVSDYRDYIRSFIKIRDPRVSEFVDNVLDAEGFWPEPLLQLNPTFSPGGTIDDLIAEGVLHEECSRIFRIGKSDADHRGKPLYLHRHQREAILKVAERRSCVLTTGTGSGKSLAYIVPIVDHVLRSGSGRGVQAIVVYPMNAPRQQPGRGAREVHRQRLCGRPVASALRAIHGAGTGRRPRGHSQRAAGHPPDELHDVGAAAYAKRRP